MNRSVSAVVFSEDGKKVLLHLRGDIRLWSLPGGRVEPGESWEDAATREVYEETGYRIEIHRLVGEYRRPQMSDTKRLFAGGVVGGAPATGDVETVRVGWFPMDRLPRNRLPWLREYVEDATLHFAMPVRRTQLQPHHQRLVMRAVFGLHDVWNWLLRRLELL